MSSVNKVVLAYSGGLDTSVIVRWLQDTYDCEVVTFTADIGQGEEVEPAAPKLKPWVSKRFTLTTCGKNLSAILFSPCFERIRFTRASTYSARRLHDR